MKEQFQVKVSVIVPIFNTDLFLKDCINSLVNQTLEEIEVLLIDDGSTDKSSLIAKEFASNYKFIKYYYKTNGGQSSARNYGINRASGEYLLFVDSDDFIDKDTCRNLYEFAKRYDAEIVRGKSLNCHEDGSLYKNQTSIYELPDKIVSGEEFIKASFKSNAYDIIPVINLIKRSFLIKNNLFFLEGYFFEDHDWTLRLFLSVEKIIQIEKPFYYYRHRNGSTTTHTSLEKCSYLEYIILEMIKNLNIKKNIPEKTWYNMTVSLSLNILISMYYKLDDSDRKIFYQNFNKSIFNFALKHPTVNRFRNYQNYLFSIHPTLCALFTSVVKLYVKQRLAVKQSLNSTRKSICPLICKNKCN